MTPELKVGMKVRAKSSGVYLGSLNKGEIGTVTSLSHISEVRVQKDGSEYSYCMKPEQLEIIPESPTFELGDKVESFGRQGVVDRIDDDEWPVGALFQIEEDHYERDFFLTDGRSQDWHKTPSLILVEKWKPMKREITMDVKMGKMGLDLGEFKDKRCKILIEEIR